MKKSNEKKAQEFWLAGLSSAPSVWEILLSYTKDDNPLFLLYWIFGEKKLGEFLRCFGGETIEVPGTDELRDAIMEHDILSTMSKDHSISGVSAIRGKGGRYNKYKSIQELSERYKISPRVLHKKYIDGIRKYNMVVTCGCGQPSKPGKLFCFDCLMKRRVRKNGR